MEFSCALSVGDILQFIIAALAFFIAYAEYQRDKKERDRQKREQSTMKDFSEKTEEILVSMELIHKFISICNDLNCIKSSEEINSFIDQNKEMFSGFSLNRDQPVAKLKMDIIQHEAMLTIVKITDVRKNVEDLYRELLHNEHAFSFSCGFERVINACRNLYYGTCEIDYDNSFSTRNKMYSEYTLSQLTHEAGLLYNKITDFDISFDKLGQDQLIEAGRVLTDFQKRIYVIDIRLFQFKPFIMELKLKYGDSKRTE